MLSGYSYMEKWRKENMIEKSILVFAALLFVFNPGIAGEPPVKIDITDFKADAGKYLGKRISVEGLISHVCKHGGRRLRITDDEGDNEIKIQMAKDAEGRIDVNHEGKHAVVVGKVVEFKMDMEYLEKLKARLRDTIAALEKEENHEDDGHIHDHHANLKMVEGYIDRIRKGNLEYVPDYSLELDHYKVK